MNVLFVTQIYFPLTGGAATNYKLLVDELFKYDDINDIYILTEYVNDEKLIENVNNNITIYRLLPSWAGLKEKKFLKKLFLFILTNLFLVFFLFWFLIARKVDVFHLHSKFVKIKGKDNYFFNIILGFLRIKAKVVVDIQDKMSVPKNLIFFDYIICGSLNILDLAKNEVNQDNKCIYIPFPFKIPKLNNNRNLPLEIQSKKPYICFVGDIIERKGIYELLQAFDDSKLNGEFSLLIVGKELESVKFCKTLESINNSYYLGSMSHKETLKIIKDAEILVLPSKSEALGRVCLEAIALGTKVLCPPEVPEFKKNCPEWVLNNIDPKTISTKMEWACSNEMLFPKKILLDRAPETITEELLKIYLN